MKGGRLPDDPKAKNARHAEAVCNDTIRQAKAQNFLMRVGLEPTRISPLGSLGIEERELRYLLNLTPSGGQVSNCSDEPGLDYTNNQLGHLTSTQIFRHHVYIPLRYLLDATKS